MIRIIAIITMLIDHVGYVFFPQMLIFRIIGRLAFPLFAWSLAKGFNRTTNYKLYLLRILLLAAISQAPYYFLFNNGHLNICFTLLNGLLIMGIIETKSNKFIKIIGLSSLVMLTQIMNFEYGLYGIATILIYYFLKENYLLVFLSQAAINVIAIILFNYNPIQSFSILGTIIVFAFQHHDFKINRLFQYIFYPAHILLILVIKLLF